MKLRYDTSVSADPAPLIMHGPDDLRVEIHIRRDEDQQARLLAMSGAPGANPAKVLQQGPYQLYDQAVAAKRAIAAQLKEAGFVDSGAQQPLWSLAAQRNINASREQKANTAGDYKFDPKDVFLDW